MKKVLMILALAAATQLAFGQKSQETVLKAIASTKAATENPKKAEKPATWISYAKAYMDAYTAPQGNGMVGMAKQELQLIMTGIKPSNVTTEQLNNGVTYEVEVYPTANYYYANGALAIIKVTKPYVEGDPLEVALKAYEQAAKLDPKGSKTKEITEAIQNIANYYQNEASNAYNFGDMAGSSVYFEKLVNAMATEPLAKVDSSSLYNAGSTAMFAKDYSRAISLLQRCIDINFLEKGEVHARLAECYKQTGDQETSRKLLEEGFQLCPENQGILVGLINLYNETNEDPNKIITLLEQAMKNEPNNASLYYVEGNIYKDMGKIEEAANAYDQCAVVNPECEMGYYYKGVMFLEQADKLAEQAQNEVNDKKYMELVEQYEAMMQKSLEPLEKSFEVTKDDRVKSNVSQYLKNVYYRFRDKGADYQAAYDKYNEIAKQYIGK